jgi:D-alanyl-D-alanine carboxypeptidase
VVTWALLVAAAWLTACSAGSEPATQEDRAPRSEELPWSSPSEQKLPAETVSALQKSLDGYLETQDAPGATAAVVTSEGVWSGAAGVDGVGSPLQPESAFAIASITKTFVAAEVLLLSAREELELDAAISDYVELPFDPRGATVRELLAMESGFPEDPGPQVMRMAGDVAGDLDREWTIDDVLDLVVPRRQGTRGGEPDYNNLNYYALGALVEEVTGDPLAVALRRDLIEPAGLDRVWVQTAEQPTPPVAVAASRPSGVAVDVDGPYLPSRALASAAGAAGAIAADAPTLARWGYQLYSGAVTGASLVQQMTAPEDDEDWYGLGTELFVQGEEAVVGHTGDFDVYHSLLAVWPASATSVVVLVPSEAPITTDEDLTPFGLARTMHEVVAG